MFPNANGTKCTAFLKRALTCSFARVSYLAPAHTSTCSLAIFHISNCNRVVAISCIWCAIHTRNHLFGWCLFIQWLWCASRRKQTSEQNWYVRELKQNSNTKIKMINKIVRIINEKEDKKGKKTSIGIWWAVFHFQSRNRFFGSTWWFHSCKTRSYFHLYSSLRRADCVVMTAHFDV